jgi:hypothetical protein
VAKYDSAGNLQWTKQLGTPSSDSANGISADKLGNVYVSGFTLGNLSGANPAGQVAYVAKYDAAGNLWWTKQFGVSAEDQSNGVSADGLGNVYVSGRTAGSLGGPNAGSYDAFVAKYDAAGNIQWTKQLGTADDDESSSVSADGLGNVYISGYTAGSLGGPNAGAQDAFLAKYDAAGNFQWTRQLGTSTPDYAVGVSTDRQHNVYISGTTAGSLGGPNAGGIDAFVGKYFDPRPGDYNGDGVVDAADYLHCVARSIRANRTAWHGRRR